MPPIVSPPAENSWYVPTAPVSAVRFLPAKKLSVESKRLLPVGGDQLVPADAARRAQCGGLPLAGRQPLQQRDHRHLRVNGDRDAADVGDVRRWDVQGAAKALDAVGGGVHVVDADISEPARPHAQFPRLLRQVHHPADRGRSGGEQGVGHAGHRRVLRAPAHDVGVEGLGGLHVRRHQLVPDETAISIDQVCFSRSHLQRSRAARIRAATSESKGHQTINDSKPHCEDLAAHPVSSPALALWTGAPPG